MPEPILLRDARPPSGAAMLLAPLALSRESTVWYGDGGTGKSYLALAASLSIHTGLPILGIEPSQRLRVALLDWESDDWTHLERMRALLPDVPEGDLPGLLYVPCGGLPLTSQVDRLRDVIEQRQIGFVVIDSVAYACDGPPEDSYVAMRFFNALKRLQVGSLLIAHISRSGDISKPFGSTFWHNSARMTWHFRQTQQTADALVVALTNYKHNSGSIAKPMGFKLAFADGQTTIRPVGVVVEPASETTTLRGRLADALRGGALTVEELIVRLNAPADSVRRTIARHGSTFVVLKNQQPHRVALMSDEAEQDNKTRQDKTPKTVSSQEQQDNKTRQGGSIRTPVCLVSGPRKRRSRKEAVEQPSAASTPPTLDPVERPSTEPPPDYVLADPVLLSDWKRRHRSAVEAS